MNKSEEQYDIVFFVLYAFLIPFVCIILMKYVPVFQNGVLQFILYGIEGASPAIAALIMSSKRRGLIGVRQFLIAKYLENASIKLCFIGLLTPALVLTLTKITTYLTQYHNQFLTMPSFKKVVIILWALIAEELGWRGYLQDKIEDRFGDKVTPLLIGIIWALWHYHFFLSGSMDVPILFFAYGCILESYGYYVLTKLAKGNVLPASLWHFSANLFFNLYLLNPNWNGGSVVPYAIASLFYTSYLGVFVWYKKKHIAKNI